MNFLDSSCVKAILFYTTLNIKLNNTIDFITFWYIYIKKATIKLKSFICYKTLNSNCFIALLLV